MYRNLIYWTYAILVLFAAFFFVLNMHIDMNDLYIQNNVFI